MEPRLNPYAPAPVRPRLNLPGATSLLSAAAVALDRICASGMIYSPAHGDTALSVSLFDGFMQRIMPPAMMYRFRQN